MASKSLSPKFLGFTSMNNCYVVVMELLIKIKVFLNSHGSCVEAVMIFVSVDVNLIFLKTYMSFSNHAEHKRLSLT